MCGRSLAVLGITWLSTLRSHQHNLVHHIPLPSSEILDLTSGSRLGGIHSFHVSTLFSVTTKKYVCRERGEGLMTTSNLLISAAGAFNKHTKNHKLWQQHICHIYMCAITFVRIKCCENYPFYRVAHNIFKQITFSQIHFMTGLGPKGNLWKVWAKSVQQWKNILLYWNICIIQKQLKLQTLNLACFIALIVERKTVQI